jgi:uncharacterized protein
MKYLITGGTGFIGSYYIKNLHGDNNEIIILSRRVKPKSGVDNAKYIKSLDELNGNEKIDVIINLAGSSINKRWSEKVKRDIIFSRVSATKDLIRLLQRLTFKPKVLISASAVGYYGPQGENELFENSDPVKCFTHDVCLSWEQEAYKASQYVNRLCIIRLGVVLGFSGGAIKDMYLPFKFGLGGRIGNGEQIFSWIHVKDVVNGMSYLVNNSNCCGIYNFTSPNPITNKGFASAMGECLHKPTLISMPSFLIRILFGEMGEELLLKGQKVIPRRLQNEGFKYEYPEIKSALKEIFNGY